MCFKVLSHKPFCDSVLALVSGSCPCPSPPQHLPFPVLPGLSPQSSPCKDQLQTLVKSEQQLTPCSHAGNVVFHHCCYCRESKFTDKSMTPDSFKNSPNRDLEMHGFAQDHPVCVGTRPKSMKNSMHAKKNQFI